MAECKNCIKQDVCDRDVRHVYSVCPHYLSADVQEVMHAKFELVYDGRGVCSNCHRLDSIDNLAKYCRYCGARLKRKQEGDDNG